MADIWFISDTHFNHSNILNFTDSTTGEKIRSFSDVHDMNEIMIDRWNAYVKPQDKVYHLGDVYFGSEDAAMTILRRLNGHKRLIVGNHDNLNSKALRNNFEKIQLWRMFSEDGFLFTHVPVHPSTLGENRFRGKSMINIHGHIHQNKSPEGPYHCVCVEQLHIDYAPVNFDTLKALHG